MKLEHRWSQRISMDLNAIGFHRPLGLVRAKIVDVSREGVLIDTGRISLPPYSIVELTFTLDMDGKPKLLQPEALKKHQHLGRRGRGGGGGGRGGARAGRAGGAAAGRAGGRAGAH